MHDTKATPSKSSLGVNSDRVSIIIPTGDRKNGSVPGTDIPSVKHAIRQSRHEWDKSDAAQTNQQDEYPTVDWQGHLGQT